MIIFLITLLLVIIIRQLILYFFNIILDYIEALDREKTDSEYLS